MLFKNAHIIIGPPGTGKSTTLKGYFRRYVEQGRDPERIAYMTFTRIDNKDFKYKLDLELGLSEDHLPWVRTIHSAALRSIRGHCDSKILSAKDWKDFCDIYHYRLSIEDSSFSVDDVIEMPVKTDDDFLLAAYMKGRSLLLGDNPDTMLSAFSPITPYKLPELRKFESFIKHYRAFKRDIGKIDFTDMLELALERQTSIPVDIAFIDEAQDLSPLQQALCEMWFADCDQVYIAGDDDQAVYSFQGASPAWLLDLTKKYPTTILQQSYRVPRLPFRVGTQISNRIKSRVAKTYYPRDFDGDVQMLDSFSLRKMVSETKNCMILSRNRCFLKRASNMMHEMGIPYLCERPKTGPNPLNAATPLGAIKAAFCLLKHEEKISRKNIDRLCSYVVVLNNPEKLLPRGVKERVKSDVKDKRLLDEMDTSEAVQIYQLGTLRKKMANDGIFSAMNRMDTEDRFYFQRMISRYNGIPDFQDIPIRVTTLHGSKGREADDIVIIPDMLQISFNELRYGNDAEHRTAYVGVTRTKKRLFVVAPECRDFYDYPLAGIEEGDEYV